MSRIKVVVMLALLVAVVGAAEGIGTAVPVFADPGSNPTASDSHGEHVTMAVEHHGNVAQAAQDHEMSVKDFQSHIEPH